MIRIFFAVLFLGTPALAEGERAGAFDYYVMALSWSPNWCALEGDARNSDQCDTRHDYGFILHGLWPQNEKGWPSYCRSNERAPSRSMTKAMTDIMGSGGLAWHQWKKHGTCSGLSARAYYETSRQAYTKIKRPEVLRKVSKTLQLPANVIEQAFLEANPTLEPDQITVTCKQNHIQEVRICLTKEFEFRRCGVDVIRDCRATKATLHPIR